MTLSVGNVPINSWHPTSVIVSLVQYKQNTHKWCRLVIVWWSEPVGKIKNESALLSHDFRDLPNQSESLNVLKISEKTHWKFRVLCFRIALIGSVCRCHSRPSAAQGAEVHGTSTWLLKISSEILARSFSLSLTLFFLFFLILSLRDMGTWCSYMFLLLSCFIIPTICVFCDKKQVSWSRCRIFDFFEKKRNGLSSSWDPMSQWRHVEMRKFLTNSMHTWCPALA